MAKVRPIPEGYHTATPYLVVEGAAKALEFYTKAFAATELFRLPGAGGKVGHCEFKIGDSIFMMADEHPEMNARGPKSFGGSPISIMIYVEDSDRVFQQAVAAGAAVERPMEDKFYGDRAGSVIDPFGHRWHISTHVEDVAPDEIERRMAKLFPSC